MTAAEHGRARARRKTREGPRLTEDRMRQVLLALAGVQFVTGIWLAVAPGNFVDTIAPFGDAPDHFLRDISTFYLALGVALLLSVSRRSWRVPVLFLAALQYAIHTLNHLLDIGGTDPAWLGYFNFAALAGFTVALGWVLAAAARGEQR